MQSNYPHIIKDIEDWPIRKFAKQRPQFIEELNGYTYSRIKEQYKDGLEPLLSKTVYLERQRVKNNPWKVDPPDDKDYWKELQAELTNIAQRSNPEEGYDQLLRRIINRYSEEIVGDFVPKTYRFAKSFLSGFFKRLYFKAFGHGFLKMWGNKEKLMSKFKVMGHMEQVRSLYDYGTVILVPTHFSNLDSIQIGYVTDERIGLPGFSFGAGLNLYDMEIIAYYLNRLGPYRVDRRKKNPIYLENLKSYTSLSLVKHNSNIFFPGGTRSRSGHLEDKLKLGLLGSVIDAQRYCIKHNLDNKIFIVPVIVSYNFVLEANSLIEQHLRKTGKEKYMKTKKRRGKIKTTLGFVKRLYTRESEVLLKFAKPIDVIGNPLNEKGESLDRNGQVVDISQFFEKEGEKNKDLQRETVYTKKLADKIVDAYREENVILASHLAAFAAFKYLQEQNRELDIYGIVQLPAKEVSIPYEEFKLFFNTLREKLFKMKALSLLDIDPELNGDLDKAIELGINNLGIYHPDSPLYIENQFVKTKSLKLLFYYHNRMDSYGL